MKELKLYTCEFCGTNYSQKRVCEECEKSHLIAKTIKRQRYVPMKNNQKGHPISIDVQFDNGDIVTYKRG